MSEYLTERTGAKIGFDDLVDFKKVETIADNLIELNQHDQCYQYLIQTCTSRDFFGWVERLQPARLDLYLYRGVLQSTQSTVQEIDLAQRQLQMLVDRTDLQASVTILLLRFE